MASDNVTLKATIDAAPVLEIIAHGKALVAAIRENAGDTVAASIETLVAGAVGNAIAAMVKIEKVDHV